VDTRALKRLLLWVGIPIMIAAFILMRRVHADTRGMELALIGLFTLGAFLTLSGLLGTLTEPPRTEDELAEDAAARSAAEPTRAPSVATAMGAYILVLAAVAGAVVGVAQSDAGAGIQTFTYGVILGGVVFGLGYLLGHRPAAGE
jgi:hypothetical protein